MQTKSLDHFHKICDSFVAQVKAMEHPSLGPAFTTLEPDKLHEALVAHRITSKYEVPDDSASTLRASTSINKMIAYDANGWSDFDYRKSPPHLRRHHLEVQQWLLQFFKGFKHSYKLRTPTGEDFVSMKGNTDLIWKLKNLSVWRVSPDLLDYIMEIIYRCDGLKRVVKQRFRETYGVEGKRTLQSLFKAFPGPNRNDRAAWSRTALRFMFRAVSTFSRVSRVSTVPKNNKEDRVITCESLWNMIAQLSFAGSLRDHLHRKLGFVLTHTQGTHRALIGAGYATIDLSKASDSNWMCVLRTIWPQRIFKYLEKMRCGILETPDGALVPLKMFAPMGTGCTFEVMTITLLAHVRVLDKGGSVFGDDIIIKSKYAPFLYDALQAHGWVINEQKSFIEGPFRESCGSFIDLRTKEYLVSYDFHRPTTIPECFLLSHKVLQIGHALPAGSLRDLFVRWYASLLFWAPRDSLMEHWEGAVRPTAGLIDYGFYVHSSIYRQRFNGWSTGVTRIVSKFWHRPVYCQRRLIFYRNTVSFKRVDSTICFAFLKRGASYCPQKGPIRERYDTYDTFTNTPLKGVLIASVIK